MTRNAAEKVGMIAPVLRHKTIIVTGSAGGLAEGIARVCHGHSANVVIAGLNEEKVGKAAARLGDRALGLSKSIAVELASEKIRVNCISPGLLNTQIWADIKAAAPNPAACADYWNANIPIARVIEPDEIGELAAFLLSDRSSCITGANIYEDGGITSQLISREPFAPKNLTPESK